MTIAQALTAESRTASRREARLRFASFERRPRGFPPRAIVIPLFSRLEAMQQNQKFRLTRIRPVKLIPLIGPLYAVESRRQSLSTWGSGL